MNSAEIKIDLFRKLDSLKGKSLKEAYGILMNYINSNSNPNDWDDLSEEQIEGIKLGLSQLDNGEGREHKDVISDLRKKYLNG